MGNITEACCSNTTVRVVIIGPDSDGKLKLYERMTKLKTNKNEMHLETRIKYLKKKMMLCCLNNTDNIPSAIKTQMEYADGVIYIVRYEDKESANEFETKYKELANTGHKVLILLNKSVNLSEEQMINFNVFQSKNKAINYRNVHIDEWKDVDDGLKWFVRLLKTDD
ncbi:hypothetical protein BDAP_001190 [Binucleata daphniae]